MSPELKTITTDYIAGTIERSAYVDAVVAEHASISARGNSRCVCMACSERADESYRDGIANVRATSERAQVIAKARQGAERARLGRIADKEGVIGA